MPPTLFAVCRHDSEVKLRARAEAKVFRAMSYIELISLWGTPPLVDHPLKANEYSRQMAIQRRCGHW